jgi:hypothetical protein
MENKETLEEVAEKYVNNKHKPASGTPDKSIQNFYDCKNAFKDGAKWQQEQDKKLYSGEEVLRLLTSFKEYLSFSDEIDEIEWFEKFKK